MWKRFSNREMLSSEVLEMTQPVIGNRLKQPEKQKYITVQNCVHARSCQRVTWEKHF